MISVKNLHKSFFTSAGEIQVLKGIDQTIEKGEKVVIVGPSGSGKSTFLRCLNRLEEPTDGEIWVDGELITQPKCNINKVRQKMGMVFQHFNLFPHLTVRQNITLAPVKLKLKTQQEADETANRLLERVGLRDKADSYPIQLSGGQKQRIAIAGCLAMLPRCLVLDEATAFADPENEHQIQKAFETLTRNKTVLMIAHRLSTVQNADNIIVLNEGKIAEQGSHSALLEKNGVYAAMWADYQRSAQWKVGKEAAV